LTNCIEPCAITVRISATFSVAEHRARHQDRFCPVGAQGTARLSRGERPGSASLGTLLSRQDNFAGSKIGRTLVRPKGPRQDRRGSKYLARDAQGRASVPYRDVPMPRAQDAQERPAGGRTPVATGVRPAIIAVKPRGRSRASRQLLPALPYLPTSLWVACAPRCTGRCKCRGRQDAESDRHSYILYSTARPSLSMSYFPALHSARRPSPRPSAWCAPCRRGPA